MANDMAIATQPPSGRTVSSKKPFSWISRFYRKASGDSSTPTHIENGTLAADISSLRPTISTRASSCSDSVIPDATDENHVTTNNATTPSPLDYSHLQTPTQAHSADMSHTPTNTSLYMNQFPEIETVITSPPSSITASTVFTERTAETAPTAMTFNGSIISNPSISAGNGLGAADNASVLTLASSSRALRRKRSLDTNCSIRALAPNSNRPSFESDRGQISGSASVSASGNNTGLIRGSVSGMSGFSRYSDLDLHGDARSIRSFGHGDEIKLRQIGTVRDREKDMDKELQPAIVGLREVAQNVL